MGAGKREFIFLQLSALRGAVLNYVCMYRYTYLYVYINVCIYMLVARVRQLALFGCLRIPNVMILVVFTGGPMRRSHSKGALFNDQVYEVPILKSPARKTCLRAGIYESGVQVPWHTQQHY
jgi:hypothetical protein